MPRAELVRSVAGLQQNLRRDELKPELLQVQAEQGMGALLSLITGGTEATTLA